MHQLNAAWAYVALMTVSIACTASPPHDAAWEAPVRQEHVNVSLEQPNIDEPGATLRDLLFRPEDRVLTVPPAKPPRATLHRIDREADALVTRRD